MQEVPLNKPHIYLFGMRRSGNHVFADWLKGMGEGGWVHYNNCTLRDDGLVETGSPVQGLEYDTSLNSLITFEDHKFNESMEKLPERVSVLLLRDPYNLFASRLQHMRTKEDSPIEMICNDAIKTWKEHADAFAGYDPYLIVSFNRWYEDQEYREHIAKRLGMEFSDEGFGSKAGWLFSGGSSFEGQPDPMNSYHNNMAEDKEFLSMFDDEMVDLARCLFGVEPPENAKYDEAFHNGVEKAVTQVLWAVHQGEHDSARALLECEQISFPHSSRLSQLLHYV